MKINGKTLQEIFLQMRWQEKVIVTCGCLFIIFAIFHVTLLTGRSLMKKDMPGAISIRSLEEKTLGMLDPSIATDGNKNTLMAFTLIRPPEKKGGDISTGVALAATTSNCAQWMRRGFSAFTENHEEILGPDGVTPVKSGVWRTETPSLVYDPEDKGREWKIFAYKYFWSNDGDKALARYYSMIVYSYTSDPAKPWSTEEWMFSTNKDIPPYPYSQLVHAHVNDLDPSLAEIYFYSRPSVTRLGDALVMSLSAYIKGRSTPDRIILIASHDHGRNWQYLGTPLRHDDLQKMGGYTRIWGASLLQKNGIPYLSLVLGNEEREGTGTMIISFENISQGLLKKDPDTGAPLVTHAIPLSSASPSKTGGGIAAYDDSCKSGLFTSEYSDIAKGFRIFKTFVEPVE